MATRGDSRELHDLLTQFKDLLEELHEQMHPTPPPRLEKVAGQGRGSKKAPAKLKSV
jgi:hypothetical protein